MRALKCLDRLSQQLDTGLAAFDQPAGAQRDPQRPREPERERELELLARQPARLPRVAKRRVNQRRLAPPQQGRTRHQNPEPRASLTALQEVAKRLLQTALRATQPTPRDQKPSHLA